MQIKEQFQNLQKEIAGQNVFIIGGGPSLENFDFDKLKGKFVVALNSSYKKTKDIASMIYWTDNGWAATNGDDLMRFKKYKVSSRIHAKRYIPENIEGFGGAMVLNKESDYGFTTDIHSVCGNNSGAQILNFMTNLKAYRLFLLGYDMWYESDTKTHHHEGYQVADRRVYGDLFIPSIESMEPFISKLKIDVINCNPKSKLTCFRKDSLEKYL